MATTIIGIDPGSRKTGYGIIRQAGNQSIYIASGYIALTSTDTSERLRKIFHELQKIIQQFQPQEAAIEQIFMHQNPNSALKLGQARGVAIVALGLPVAEYSARQVKQSVVGYGAASKDQVQHMVKQLLNLRETLQADEADALAIALCHAHTQSGAKKIVTGLSIRRHSSWRNYQPKEKCRVD